MGEDDGVPVVARPRVRALVRPPGPRLVDGLVTHLARTPVDLDLATRQWRGYVDALGSNGWAIVEVAGADDCPDAVFIEDTVVMFDDLAVITRPGAPSRVPETTAVEATVTGLGYDIARIEPPGTLDGGDVLKVDDVVYVGVAGRTNADGVGQLAALVEPKGRRVIGVPVTKVLHLKSAITALPDGTIVGWPAAVDDAAMFDRFLATPEESGAHVVVLDCTHLLIAADCPRSAEMYRAMGYEPLQVDIGEFQKLEGCVTCLSVRLRT